MLKHRLAYKTAKAPTTAATTPAAPTAHPTFPAAPVESTRDAEADDLAAEPDEDRLALSISTSAAPFAKVGMVLTHDLLMLKLVVVIVDVVDAGAKVGRSFMIVVEDAALETLITLEVVVDG